MEKGEVRSGLIKIIQDINPDLDLSNLKDNVRLRDQIDIDSMDFLDIVMEIRKQYKVEVPESDYMQISNLAGAVDYISKRLN